MADFARQNAGDGSVVFLLDCDNTLLDNDAIKADMSAQLLALLGPTLSDRFWAIYEEVREETGTVDLPLTFERFRPFAPSEPVLEQARSLVMDYPFSTRLFPATLTTLRYLDSIGTPVVLSDGDNVYQPKKIRESGLESAVEGRVAIYVHKEEHLDEVMARWPASLYVMVDDKARILAATKERMPHLFVTVWVKQGHYATGEQTYNPAPDITLAHIDELRNLTVADYRAVQLRSEPTA